MHGTSSGKTSSKDLRAYFSTIRAHTEFLCEPLETEDYIPQPTVDVSPARWNIAHTTWFFEEMVLKKHLRGYEPFDENFGYLFNSYYNTLGDRTKRDDRGSLSRPTVARIFEYRSHVDEKLSELLAGPISRDVEDLVVLGLNHEQQHQEGHTRPGRLAKSPVHAPPPRSSESRAAREQWRGVGAVGATVRRRLRTGERELAVAQGVGHRGGRPGDAAPRAVVSEVAAAGDDAPDAPRQHPAAARLRRGATARRRWEHPPAPRASSPTPARSCAVSWSAAGSGGLPSWRGPRKKAMARMPKMTAKITSDLMIITPVDSAKLTSASGITRPPPS